MPSPVPNYQAGVAASRAERSAAAEGRVWEVYRAVRHYANRGGMARTLDGIAKQFNDYGLRTRGTKAKGPGLYNAPRVNEVLKRLGLDRKQIDRWRDDALAYAFENKIPSNFILFLLWHEWLDHETRVLYDLQLGYMAERPVFDPTPLFCHQDDWLLPTYRRPLERNPYGFMPPSALIVHAWIGAFEDDPKARYIAGLDDPIDTGSGGIPPLDIHAYVSAMVERHHGVKIDDGQRDGDLPQPTVAPDFAPES